jgi:ClpP class serine protease
LRNDLQAALDDPTVSAIILNIDSPGGEASGANELAQAVYEARGSKPIVAYVGGTGASAAYWIASAARPRRRRSDRVLGSIGVQAGGRRVRSRRPARRRYRFISSQSPNKNAGSSARKRPRAHSSDDRRDRSSLCRDGRKNRGVAIETVLNEFGKGGIFVGQSAIDAGLADSIGTFETVLAELSAAAIGKMGVNMADENFTAEQRDAAVAAALAAEKTRVAGLRTIAASFGASDADLTAAIDGSTTVEAFSLAVAEKARLRRCSRQGRQG